jgi:hypothetical protein
MEEDALMRASAAARRGVERLEVISRPQSLRVRWSDGIMLSSIPTRGTFFLEAIYLF